MKLNQYSLIAAIVLGGLVTTSTFVKAGDEKKPAAGEQKRGLGGSNGEMKQDIFDQLGLSDNQKKKMEALQEEFWTQVIAIVKNASLPEEDKKAKVKALGAEHKKKIKAILSPEQFAKLEKLIANRPGGANNPSNPKGEPKPKKSE